VAAVAILVGKNGTHSLLVSKRRFHNFQRHRLRLARRHCAELIPASNRAKNDRRGGLPARVGNHRCRIEADARGSVKLNHCAGDRGPLVVIDLYHQWIFQCGAGDTTWWPPLDSTRAVPAAVAFKTVFWERNVCSLPG